MPRIPGAVADIWFIEGGKVIPPCDIGGRVFGGNECGGGYPSCEDCMVGDLEPCPSGLTRKWKVEMRDSGRCKRDDFCSLCKHDQKAEDFC